MPHTTTSTNSNQTIHSLLSVAHAHTDSVTTHHTAHWIQLFVDFGTQRHCAKYVKFHGAFTSDVRHTNTFRLVKLSAFVQSTVLIHVSWELFTWCRGLKVSYKIACASTVNKSAVIGEKRALSLITLNTHGGTPTADTMLSRPDELWQPSGLQRFALWWHVKLTTWNSLALPAKLEQLQYFNPRTSKKRDLFSKILNQWTQF